MGKIMFYGIIYGELFTLFFNTGYHYLSQRMKLHAYKIIGSPL